MELFIKFVVLALLLSIVEISAQSDLDSCPPGLNRTDELKTFGNVCLLFESEARSWHASRVECQKNGGDLIQIKNSEMQTFVETSLKELNWTSQGVWIGASDDDDEGVWKWVTGERVTYGKWHEGQGPSQHGFFFSSGAFEDCALLRLDDNFRWHDYPCSTAGYLYSFICEYDRVKVNDMITETTSANSAPSTQEPAVDG